MGNILTRKKVRVGLKNGWSTEVFCQEYDCDEKTLEKRIVGLYRYRKPVDEVLSILADNDKKAEHRKRKKADEVALDSEEPLETTTASSDESVETPICEKTSLKYLQSAEKRLSKNVMSLELQHKAEVEKRRECLQQLRDAKAEIEKIEAGLKEKWTECTATIARANEITESLNDIVAKRRPQVERLLEVRAAIEKMRTVTIAVYDSGEIALLEGVDFSLNDSGYEDIYASLLEKEECSELRLKDIRVLARMLSIKSNSNRSIGVICDRPELEKAFLRLSARS